MNRRRIFIGPEYPPNHIINSLRALTIYINAPTYMTGVADNVNALTGLNYITNLASNGKDITFDAVCTNPITREIFSIPGNSDVINTVVTEGAGLAIFNGGSTIYPISPCCVIMSYITDTNISNTTISCAHPVSATLAETALMIKADRDRVVINQATASPAPYGVRSINGISTTSGGINIRGVGTVTVSVTGADSDKTADNDGYEV